MSSTSAEEPPASSAVVQRRSAPLASEERSSQHLQQQQQQQHHQRSFMSVISLPSEVFNEEDAADQREPAKEEEAAPMATVTDESPDSQLELDRSQDSLTANLAEELPEQEDCSGDVGRGGIGRVGVVGGGSGGAASSDEGLISGEDDEIDAAPEAKLPDAASATVDNDDDFDDYDDRCVEDEGDGATVASPARPGSQPPSKGAFRRKFEASLRRKAAADSAELERRRSSSLLSQEQRQKLIHKRALSIDAAATGAASAAAATDDSDAAAAVPAVGSVAVRSVELRQRLESSFRPVSEIQTNRSSSQIKTDPNWRPAIRCLTPGGQPASTAAAPATATTAPASTTATTMPASAGWRVEGGGASGEPRRFLFGEPSLSVGFLAATAAPASASSAPAVPGSSPPQRQQQPPPRPEISLPTGNIQETRKEGYARVTRLAGGGGKPQAQSTGKSKDKGRHHSSSSSSSSSSSFYRLLLTGPDLVFYRASGSGSGCGTGSSGGGFKSDKKPEFALNVAATEISPPPPAPSPQQQQQQQQPPQTAQEFGSTETGMRLRYVSADSPAAAAAAAAAAATAAATDDEPLGRYADIYPSGAGECDLLLQWDEPGQRKEWTMALTYAKHLLTERMYRKSAGPIDWGIGGGSGGGRKGIAQRLNDFFRRRPALHELVDRGIVRNEPVFGSTLRLICQHEHSEVPNFLSRCLAAIEAHGLDTEGIYRLPGNAATVQKLRLLVDQNDSYDLETGWDVHVLTSALKTFLRELKEPMIPHAIFQEISDHHRSGAKPSAKRESIRQALRGLPQYHYASMRLLFGHLSRVVSQSGTSQMNSQNLALMFGPNLVWPDQTSKMCLTSSLMYQSQVVEYILLEADYLFRD